MEVRYNSEYFTAVITKYASGSRVPNEALLLARGRVPPAIRLRTLIAAFRAALYGALHGRVRLQRNNH